MSNYNIINMDYKKNMYEYAWVLTCQCVYAYTCMHLLYTCNTCLHYSALIFQCYYTYYIYWILTIQSLISACKERWFKLRANMLFYYRLNEFGGVEKNKVCIEMLWCTHFILHLKYQCVRYIIYLRERYLNITDVFLPKL